jgi:hypothetical protein
MNIKIKNVTIQFVCNNCLRKKSIYLCISIEINDLADLIMSRKCLSCGKGGLNISHINFVYDQ